MKPSTATVLALLQERPDGLTRRVYNQYNSPGIETRFWEKVDKRGPDDCWEWSGSRHFKGYGQILFKGRVRKAHRVSWELANGPIPPGLLACHRCDNPPCVNPSHLFLGTNRDNIRDAFRKGRITRAGVANGRAKLHPDFLPTIRQRRLNGDRTDEIARDYGVCVSTINRALTGRNWSSHRLVAPVQRNLGL